MTEEQSENPPVMLQPQYGLAPSQSLEVTEHFTSAGVEPWTIDKISKVIESGYFPPEMINHFWAYINPDIPTSIMDEHDIRSFMAGFKADRKLFLKTHSKKKIEEEGFEFIKKLDNLEILVEARARKALYGELLERLTQQTQVNVMGQAQQNVAPGMNRGSWVSQIPKRLFGGGRPV